MAVVGGGVFGASASLELARRGHRVVLFDPGPLPHPMAASTDVSKIVRMDYGTDGFYTELARQALAGWDARNRRRDPPLFHPDGFLILSREKLRPGSFEHESWSLLRERSHPLERLDRAALSRRFPAWTGSDVEDGYLNPRAGWVESGAVVARILEEAAEAGVRIVQERVRGLLEGDAGVEGLRTEAGARRSADRVVVAAGAWTPSLLPGLAPVMRASGQPVFHLRPRNPEPFRPHRFPPWAVDISATGWYGFPALPDGTVKVANHGTGIPVDPDAPPELSRAWEGRLRTFLAATLPELAEAPLEKTRLCPYCDTPDGDFWIARDPRREGLVVAAGGSGHAFKFAPVLGGIVADVAEGRENRWATRFRWREPRPGTESARSDA